MSSKQPAPSKQPAHGKHPAPLAPGAKVGRLEVERVLGAGAHATVYLARDVDVGRRVALKVVPAARLLTAPESRERLLEEARVLGRLRGPNVVHLHHVHRLPGGDVGLEFEHVEGGSLAARLEATGPLAADEVVRLALGVLAALAEAHALGIVHRDVKPANVLLERDGTAKLGDFGLASVERARSEGGGSSVEGSPAYLAPEVLLGAPHSPRSDLWSLGVTLHAALTGRDPFQGEDLPQLFFAVLNAAPPLLPARTPPALVAGVARLLAKRAGDRPASALDARRLFEPPSGRRVPSEVRPLPAAEGAEALVGRDAERAVLADVLGRARAGEGSTVALLGEAGLGKSSLSAWTRSLALQDGLGWLELRFGSGEGLWRGLARVVKERRRAGLPLPLLEPPSEEPVARALRVLLGEAPAEEAAEHREQSAWALEAFLEGLLASGPLVFLVDDLHLAPAGDLATLRDVVRRLAAKPVVWLLTARTGSEVGPAAEPALEALAEGGTFPVTHRLRLAPLPQQAVDRLLTHATGGSAPEPEVLAHLLRQGGGNPLWTLELLAHLEANQALERSGAALRRGPRWGEVGVPATFRELVAARSARLSTEDRRLLEAACVDGLEFDGQAVATAAGLPLLEALRRLQELARPGGLLVPGGSGVRFAHALVRDALYEALLPEYRRELHRTLAEHLEARTPAADPERTGTHWERAGEPARASPHLLRAALQAAHRQEHARTIDFCERGGLVPGSIRPEQARPHAELVLHLLHALQGAKRHAELERAADDLEAAAKASGDEELQLKILVERSFLRAFVRGSAPVDVVALRRAISLLPPGRALGRAHYVLGLRAKYEGRLESATQHFESAEQHWRSLGLSGWQSSATDQLASVELRRGHPERAVALYEAAERQSLQAGRQANAAVSAVNRALALAELGDMEGLPDLLAASQRVFERELMGSHAGHAAVLQARALLARGRLLEAEAALERSAGLLQGVTYAPVLVDAHLVRARCAHWAGRLQEARAALEEADSAQADTELDSSRLGVLAERVRLASTLGAWDEAVSTLEVSFPAALPSASGSGRDEMRLALAEALAYGLSPTTVRKAVEALERAGCGSAERPVRDLLARLLVASEEDKAGADPTVEPGGGARGGWSQALCSLLEDHAAAMRTATAASVPAWERMLRRAEELAHRPLQLVALRRLGERSAAARAALLERLRAPADSLADTALRARFVRAWTER